MAHGQQRARDRFLGIVGFYLMFSIWCPVLWFVSSSMDRHQIGSFDVSILGWTDVVMYLAVIGLALAGQVGFIMMAADQGKLERAQEQLERLQEHLASTPRQ